MAVSHSLHAPAISPSRRDHARRAGGREHGDAVGESLRDVWRQIAGAMFDTYHPERHYMRGPGPACAAKRRSTFK